MRMWNVDPKCLCRKHLLGEHVECHMFIGTINKGTSLKGYIEKGLVEVHNIEKRHDVLKDEMERRGMNHNSSLPECNLWEEGNISVVDNIEELKNRCPECRQRINNLI